MTRRTLNISLRTIHIVTMGILLGGYAFDVEPARLTSSWLLTVGSGVALAIVETGLRLLWFHQIRGLMMLVKLIVIFAVPLAGDSGLPLLVAVVVLASVTSHMPARFRYYSVIYGADALTRERTSSCSG